MSDDIRKLANDLERWSMLEGTEYGEYLEHLAAIARYDYCFGKGFSESVEKELSHHINYFQTKCKIVTVTHKSVEYTSEELEWSEDA